MNRRPMRNLAHGVTRDVPAWWRVVISHGRFRTAERFDIGVPIESFPYARISTVMGGIPRFQMSA